MEVSNSHYNLLFILTKIDIWKNHKCICILVRNRKQNTIGIFWNEKLILDLVFYWLYVASFQIHITSRGFLINLFVNSRQTIELSSNVDELIITILCIYCVNDICICTQLLHEVRFLLVLCKMFTNKRYVSLYKEATLINGIWKQSNKN
jgi:hypothetical protein